MGFWFSSILFDKQEDMCYVCCSTTLEYVVNDLGGDGCKAFGIIMLNIKAGNFENDCIGRIQLPDRSTVSLTQKTLGSCCRLW